jgi:hypothetical protein
MYLTLFLSLQEFQAGAEKETAKPTSVTPPEQEEQEQQQPFVVQKRFQGDKKPTAVTNDQESVANKSKQAEKDAESPTTKPGATKDAKGQTKKPDDSPHKPATKKKQKPNVVAQTPAYIEPKDATPVDVKIVLSAKDRKKAKNKEIDEEQKKTENAAKNVQEELALAVVENAAAEKKAEDLKAAEKKAEDLKTSLAEKKEKAKSKLESTRRRPKPRKRPPA